MAIDRALVDHAADHGTVVRRLYRWAGHTVSFGANESARRTWDREALERAQLPCVRRPTGGRGVWHDAADLTYAVTAPVAEFGGLRLAYRVIHEQLAGALRRLGADASVAPGGQRRPTLEPGACFDLAVGGEVLVSGRKTVGSAQALFGRAMLQHGAIARGDRGPALARFRLSSGRPAPAASDHLELPPVDLLAEMILTAWRTDGATPVPVELIYWAERQSGRYAACYQDLEWTWRR